MRLTAQLLQREIAKRNLPYGVRFVPAEDESVDSEYVATLAGETVPVSLQLGLDGYSVNTFEYENGELVSMTMVGDFDHGHEISAAKAFASTLAKRKQ